MSIVHEIPHGDGVKDQRKPYNEDPPSVLTQSALLSHNNNSTPSPQFFTPHLRRVSSAFSLSGEACSPPTRVPGRPPLQKTSTGISDSSTPSTSAGRHRSRLERSSSSYTLTPVATSSVRVSSPLSPFIKSPLQKSVSASSLTLRSSSPRTAEVLREARALQNASPERYRSSSFNHKTFFKGSSTESSPVAAASPPFFSRRRQFIDERDQNLNLIPFPTGDPHTNFPSDAPANGWSSDGSSTTSLTSDDSTPTPAALRKRFSSRRTHTRHSQQRTDTAPHTSSKTKTLDTNNEWDKLVLWEYVSVLLSFGALYVVSLIVFKVATLY